MPPMMMCYEALKTAWEMVKEKLDSNTPEFKKTLSQVQESVIWSLEKATWQQFDEETKSTGIRF